MPVGDVQTARVVEKAIDIHRFDHHATEIFPSRERDALTLFRGFFGESAFEIEKRALVPAVERRDQAPRLRRDTARKIDRGQADETDEKAQDHIFEPVAQVAPEREF